MFLAAIYPLSEKSALNLSGKVNTNNVTYFESEEEYLINAGCARPATATAGTETAESGAGAAEEKGEVGDADGESDQMDIEKSDPAGDADLPAPEIAYDLYRAFWRLQVLCSFRACLATVCYGWGSGRCYRLFVTIRSTYHRSSVQVAPTLILTPFHLFVIGNAVVLRVRPEERRLDRAVARLHAARAHRGAALRGLRLHR